MSEPEDDPLAGSTGYALRRAAMAMLGDLAERLTAIDCRISEASVLLLIAERKDVTATRIAHALEIKRTNMVPLLNRLESRGLVKKVPIDGKSQAVVLTPKGRRRGARALTITQQFEEDLIARIPREHRKHLLPALRALWL